MWKLRQKLNDSLHTPSSFYKMKLVVLYIFQDTFPLWFHQLHVVNAPKAFNVMYDMARPFLHKRTVENLKFHRDINSLHEYVDKEILPAEYGGQVGPFDNQLAASAVYQMLDYFVQLKEYVHQ